MAETTVEVAEGPALVLAGYEGEPLRSLDAYRAVGGYAQLDRARAQDPQAVIQEVIARISAAAAARSSRPGETASFIPTPDNDSEADLHHRQRGRIRAGDLQRTARSC
jgi:hypothetical protein